MRGGRASIFFKRRRLPPISRRRKLSNRCAGAFVAAAVLATGWPALALVLNDNFNGAGFTVINGTTANQLLTGIDSNNVFNNVVSLGSGSCTGTLINSTTILTAAHCFFTPTGANAGAFSAQETIGFTPNGSSVASTIVTPALTIVNPNYNILKSSNADIALIILPTPITNVTPVQLLQLQPGNAGFPTAGTPLLISGFGLNGTGSSPPTSNSQGDNQRRVAQTTLGIYGSLGAAFVPGANNTQNGFSAQFQDPASPATYNFYNLATPVTTAAGGTASGDSGGPVFYCPLAGNVGCTPSQLVEIGDLIGGGAPSTPAGIKESGYGDISSWTPINLFLSWVNGSSGTLALTASPGTSNWSAATSWIGGAVPGTTNMAWLNGATAMTLDVNATVSSLWLSNSQASFSIGAPLTLTVATGTTINSGTLSVFGTLSTPLLGMTGGMLNGSGTINTAGGIVSNYAGTVMPGTSTAIGTLTIVGSYQQSPGATLFIKAGGTSADLLNVNGAATLGGNLQVQLLPQSNLIQTGVNYTILNSTGLSGTFANVPPQQISAFLLSSVSYTATGVTLSLARDASYLTAANTPNQINLANALNNGRTRSNLSNDMEDVYALLDDASVQQANGFLGVADADGTTDDVIGNQLLANFAAGRVIQGALDQHLAALRDGTASLVQNATGLGQLDFGSGSGAAFGFAAAPVEGGFAPFDVALNDRGNTGLSPAASGQAPYAVWLHSIGAWQDLRTDENAPGVSQQLTGVIGGIDVDVPPEWMRDLKVGMAFSYTASALGGGSETGNTDAYRISAYGTKSFGRAYVDGQLTFGGLQMSTNRALDTLGLGLTAAGSTSGDELSAALNAGYRQPVAQWLLEPSVGVSYIRETRQGYTESGADALDMIYDSSSLDSLRWSAGLRAMTSVSVGDGYFLRPELRARYAYDTGNLAPITTGTLEGLPGLPFNFAGVDLGRNSGTFGAGVTLTRHNGLALFADYSVEARQYETVQTAWAGARATW